MAANNIWLIAGGVFSAVAAALHLAIIAGGPAWYRFFHAGPRLVELAAAGSWRPPAITLGIAAILALWSVHAFAGAGLLPPPPLLRAGLVAIAAIYLGRAAAIVPLALFRPARADTFMVVSSVIVLGGGLAYAAGAWRAWPHLAG